MLVTGDGEATAFPATEVSKRFVLESGSLRESTSEDIGGLSAVDLQGSKWTLSEWIDADGMKEIPQIKLPRHD